MFARVIIAAAVLGAAGAPGANARDLDIALPGENDSAVERAYAKPFSSATGIAVQVSRGEASLDALRIRKEGEAALDVVALRGDTLLAACDEGLLDKLDWSAIGGRDHYLPVGVSDCGVGLYVSSLLLAWDREKFQGTPTWSDFWDVAKYPGKRGLPRGPRYNLEIALMADGVAPADVYRTLRSAEGIERAFRKLDQIRPYAVWWDTEADATRLLNSGEVLMTAAGNGRIATANRDDNRNFGMQWAGSMSSVESWAVAKGSANAKQALQFLYFAGSSAIQARFSTYVPYSGLAKGAVDGLPPDIAAALPLNPPNQAGALAIDEGFWRENADKLGQRFAAWLAR